MYVLLFLGEYMYCGKMSSVRFRQGAFFFTLLFIELCGTGGAAVRLALSTLLNLMKALAGLRVD